MKLKYKIVAFCFLSILFSCKQKQNNKTNVNTQPGINNKTNVNTQPGVNNKTNLNNKKDPSNIDILKSSIPAISAKVIESLTEQQQNSLLPIIKRLKEPELTDSLKNISEIDLKRILDNCNTEKITIPKLKLLSDSTISPDAKDFVVKYLKTDSDSESMNTTLTNIPKLIKLGYKNSLEAFLKHLSEDNLREFVFDANRNQSTNLHFSFIKPIVDNSRDAKILGSQTFKKIFSKKISHHFGLEFLSHANTIAAASEEKYNIYTSAFDAALDASCDDRIKYEVIETFKHLLIHKNLTPNNNFTIKPSDINFFAKMDKTLQEKSITYNSFEHFNKERKLEVETTINNEINAFQLKLTNWKDADTTQLLEQEIKTKIKSSLEGYTYLHYLSDKDINEEITSTITSITDQVSKPFDIPNMTKELFKEMDTFYMNSYHITLKKAIIKKLVSMQSKQDRKDYMDRLKQLKTNNYSDDYILETRDGGKKIGE